MANTWEANLSRLVKDQSRGSCSLGGKDEGSPQRSHANGVVGATAVDGYPVGDALELRATVAESDQVELAVGMTSVVRHAALLE
jgi:hypothetical protein